MDKSVFFIYLGYTLLVIFLSIYLPIDNFFSIEYVLLGIQAMAAFSYYAFLIRNESAKKKYESTFSLIVVIGFIGILYYATFHLLVLGLSGLVLAGWFWVQKTAKG